MNGELTWLARTLLFLASYAPLFGLLSVLHWNTAAGWLFALIAGIGVVGGAWVLHIVQRGQEQLATVLDATSNYEALAGYLLGWLMPFIVLQPNDISSVASLGLFFVLLGLVYVRGNLVHLNPFLALLGYHVWEVTALVGRQRQRFTLLTKAARVDRGDKVYYSITTHQIRYGRVDHGR